jgi:hypothetical protein
MVDLRAIRAQARGADRDIHHRTVATYHDVVVVEVEAQPYAGRPHRDRMVDRDCARAGERALAHLDVHVAGGRMDRDELPDRLQVEPVAVERTNVWVTVVAAARTIDTAAGTRVVARDPLVLLLLRRRTTIQGGRNPLTVVRGARRQRRLLGGAEAVLRHRGAYLINQHAGVVTQRLLPNGLTNIGASGPVEVLLRAR